MPSRWQPTARCNAGSIHRVRPISSRVSPRPAEIYRTGSWRRSELPEVLCDCFLNRRETFRAVGVRKRDIGRICAICLTVRLRRDPANEIGGCSRFVSNEPAETTHREQRRRAERLSYRSGRRRAGCLSKGLTGRHRQRLSCTRRIEIAMQRCVERYAHSYKGAQLFVELGNVPVLFEQLTRFRLHADCTRQVFTRMSVLRALIFTIRFADSPYRRRGLRREQGHDS
jgi:hypothetical protein